MPKPETMKLVNFRVKPSLWTDVNRVAVGRGLRLAEAVREALTEYVQRNYRHLASTPDATDDRLDT